MKKTWKVGYFGKIEEIFIRDNPYFTSDWVRKIAFSVDVFQYCIYDYIVVWVGQKSPKICWRIIGMALYWPNDQNSKKIMVLHLAYWLHSQYFMNWFHNYTTMCYDGQKVRTKNSWSSMWRIDQLLHSQYFMNWFYNYSSMWYGQKV